MSTDRIAVDANVLVYALYRDTSQHRFELFSGTKTL